MKTIDLEKYKVNQEDICFKCGNVKIDKITNKELKNIEDSIQSRVVSAIELSANINNKSYNVFAIGPSGSGKKDFIKNIIQKKIPQKDYFDICYVYNFSQPNNPQYLKLKAGDSETLKQDNFSILQKLRVIIPFAFRSSSYMAKINDVKESFYKQEAKDFEEINKSAKELNLTIKQGEKEYGVIPLKEDGTPMKKEDIKQLTEQDKEDLNQRFKSIQQKLQKFLEKQPNRENDLINKVEAINVKQVKMHTSKVFGRLKRKWSKKQNGDAVIDYLQQLEDEVIKNYKKLFEIKTKESLDLTGIMVEEKGSNIDEFFAVNIITNSKNIKQTPVISVNSPSAESLFGSITKDHEKNYEIIKGGAFHDALNGYLILDASKILVQPELWEKIKNTLKYEAVKIHKQEGLLTSLSGSGSNKEPQNIPNTAKVIMVGSGSIYNALIQYDTEFNNLFKSVANFTNTLKINAKTLQFFYNKLLDITKDENLLPLGESGFAKIVKHASKEAGDQKRITANFRKMADLLREGNYVAQSKKSNQIEKEHIVQAIESHVTRVNVLNSHIKDSMKDNTILINTKGQQVGQINGLAVYEVYGRSFGQPQRITANSYKDGTGIIDIQKSAEMGGKIYSKASLIVDSFIKSKFSKVKNLNFGVGLNFEQAYNYVDGDSASVAAVVCILSSLANLKIDQSIAVTGAMSQTGEVLAIGGVNEKIEGFFDICKDKGTKNNGVVIPETNVKNIVLREDIENAVKEGTFNIYAVSNVEQAIEIFFNMPAGKINKNGSYNAGTVYGEIYNNFFLEEDETKEN